MDTTTPSPGFYSQMPTSVNNNSSLMYGDDGIDLMNSTYPANITEDDSASLKYFMDQSRYIVQIILVPIVLVIGLGGNIVTIIILTKKHMRSSTNHYLTALAVSDLLYLIFVFTLSIKHYDGMSDPKHWIYWHYYKYAHWLTDASSKCLNSNIFYLFYVLLDN